ncbi:MAG: hypothetical protein R3B11_13555 [Nitrospira sp.]|nr:hypothetical protein [Nitrospira sp.]MDR4477012.1 hypothetical protein [Nitrospira sp.]
MLVTSPAPHPHTGIVPTYQPSHFDRVYAAYGGWFIILSILWGGLVDHVELVRKVNLRLIS